MIQLKTKRLTANSAGNHKKYQIILGCTPKHCCLNKIGNKTEINKNLNSELRIVKNHQQRGGCQHKSKAGD